MHSHFPSFSVPYCWYKNVHSHFPSFSVFLAILLVRKCVFLIFHDFQFSRHTAVPTVCISHFHLFECLLLYSRSYSVHLLFSMFLNVFHHNPGQTVFVSFPTFFSFLSIFQVLQCIFLFSFHSFSPYSSCVFLIFCDFPFPHHAPGPIAYNSHFLCF